MYFDTHCHLNSEDLYEDHDMFIQNALNNEVTNMVVVGYDLESSKIAIEYMLQLALDLMIAKTQRKNK